MSINDELWLSWTRSVCSGTKSLVHKNEFISPIFLNEVVDAIDKVLEDNQGNIFQLSRTTEISYESLFKKFFEYSRRKCKQPVTTSGIEFVTGAITHSSLDCDVELLTCIGDFDLQFEKFVSSLYL